MRRVANVSLSLYLRVRSRSGEFAEVLGRHLVKELAELLDFVLGGDLGIWNVDAGLIEEGVIAPNRYVSTQCQGDGV